MMANIGRELYKIIFLLLFYTSSIVFAQNYMTVNHSSSIISKYYSAIEYDRIIHVCENEPQDVMSYPIPIFYASISDFNESGLEYSFLLTPTERYSEIRLISSEELYSLCIVYVYDTILRGDSLLATVMYPLNGCSVYIAEKKGKGIFIKRQKIGMYESCGIRCEINHPRKKEYIVVQNDDYPLSILIKILRKPHSLIRGKT